MESYLLCHILGLEGQVLSQCLSSTKPNVAHGLANIAIGDLDCLHAVRV